MTTKLTWDYVVQTVGMDSPTPALSATVETLDKFGQWVIGSAAVNYETDEWRFQDETCTWSHSPQAGWTLSNEVVTIPASGNREGWKPEALKLFFPAELPIWGRELDEWLIANAAADGDDLHLTLLYLPDPDLMASATISRRWRVVTAFITPWQEWILTDIMPVSAASTPLQEALFEL
ncbi:hypothetical protein AAGW05_12235 [Arthrobacter sp. LAPM80]|uniref:hypothetical protein n=1 Tax=Arthrobacter sp. LAPM80 TaxID=3141788 RepID=UPI00398AF187